MRPTFSIFLTIIILSTQIHLYTCTLSKLTNIHESLLQLKESIHHHHHEPTSSRLLSSVSALKTFCTTVKATHGFVIVTLSNKGFQEMLMNFLCHFQHVLRTQIVTTRYPLSAENFLIYVQGHDLEYAKELAQLGYYVFIDPQDDQSMRHFASFEAFRYQQLILSRTLIIKKIFLDFQVSVLLVDNDSVWLKNPLPIVMSLQQDRKAHLVAQPASPTMASGGFLFLPVLNSTQKMWKSIAQQHYDAVNAAINTNSTKVAGNEQYFINHYIRDHDRFRLTLLPINQFPNGNVYFDDKTFDRSKVVVVHNNHIVGLQPKLDRFQANHLLDWDGKKCQQLDNTQPRNYVQLPLPTFPLLSTGTGLSTRMPTIHIRQSWTWTLPNFEKRINNCHFSADPSFYHFQLHDRFDKIDGERTMFYWKESEYSSLERYNCQGFCNSTLKFNFNRFSFTDFAYPRIRFSRNMVKLWRAIKKYSKLIHV